MNYNNEYDNVMKELIDIFKEHPRKAYDYVSNNYYKFDKNELTNIIKEMLYSLDYHINNNFYGALYGVILEDAANELEEQYDYYSSEESE